jgi:hypothetical protein
MEFTTEIAQKAAMYQKNKELLENANYQIQNKLKEKLSERGFNFETETEFSNFYKERICLTSPTDQDPNIRQSGVLHLDYIDADNKGDFLFLYICDLELGEFRIH